MLPLVHSFEKSDQAKWPLGSCICDGSGGGPESEQPRWLQAHACAVLLWSQYTKQPHLLTDGHKETSKKQRTTACESTSTVCGQRRFRGPLLMTSEAVCGSGLLNGYQEEAKAFAAKACNADEETRKKESQKERRRRF